MTRWFLLIVATFLLLLVCGFGKNSSWAGQEVASQGELVRFTKAKDGVITDRVTNLEWYVGPDQDTTWHQAKAWMESLTVAGGGWRLPTVAELKTLYQRGASLQNIDPIFKTSGFFVWSVQIDASSAWLFHFALIGGQEYWDFLDGFFLRRAFAVRSRR
jgi:hypothetical protein